MHDWITGDITQKRDLLPGVRAGFNGRKIFRKAVGVVQAVNKLSNNNLKKSNEMLTISSEKSSDSLAFGIYRS